MLIFFLDFVRGPYGKGLYFSMQACQAAAFSGVNFLVKVVYLNINRASLSISSPMFSPPPWMSRREPWDRVSFSDEQFPNSQDRLCMNRVRSLLSLRCTLLGYSFKPWPNSSVLAIAGLVLTIALSINGSSHSKADGPQ